MTRRIEIVVNPASGSKLGDALVSHHIQPLLNPTPSRSGPDTIRIRRTETKGDGVRIGREIARDYSTRCGLEDEEGDEVVVDVVVVGGDGTTHELLNGLYLDDGFDHNDGARRVGVRLGIVPGGTANALYSAMYPGEWTQEVQHQVATAKTIEQLDASVVQVMLRSVVSLVSGEAAKLYTLPMMLNELEEGGGRKLVISHLVTSHALHASILHDADTPEMRQQYAGIERFKIAAQLNATRWTRGTLTLHAVPTNTADTRGQVFKYVPETREFGRVSGGELRVEGPFLYLNAMVTDRLESSFVPAPLSSAFSTSIPDGAIDVVVIRPTRDPALSQTKQTEETDRVKFATTRLGEITAAMYKGGKHIDQVYANGQVIVEYFRCAGYAFTPDTVNGGDKARLVCTDGWIWCADRVEVSRWTDEPTGGGVRRMCSPLAWR